MSRKAEKKVPIRQDTVMKLYHIQFGEDLTQQDLAKDINCSEGHLCRTLKAGICAESFRENIARFLDVIPSLLGEEYTGAVQVQLEKDLPPETVCPEDVLTYSLHETIQVVNQRLLASLEPYKNALYSLGLQNRFDSYSEKQQQFICFLLRDYIDVIFEIADKIPPEKQAEAQKLQRKALKKYLEK